VGRDVRRSHLATAVLERHASAGSDNGALIKTLDLDVPGPMVVFGPIQANLSLRLHASMPYTYQLSLEASYITFTPSASASVDGAVATPPFKYANIGLDGEVNLFQGDAINFGVTKVVMGGQTPAVLGLLVGDGSSIDFGAGGGDLGLYYQIGIFKHKLIPIVSWKGYSDTLTVEPATWRYYTIQTAGAGTTSSGTGSACANSGGTSLRC
jgi:hypothetical protein